MEEMLRAFKFWATVRTFCEKWSPYTNTLVTAARELSISLWDLHKFGGLLIFGDLFDDVVPSSRELTGSSCGKQHFLPQTCEYLFHAFHLLLHRSKGNELSIVDWSSFWCDQSRKYTAPPTRKESKTKRFHQTHNPTGQLPRESPFTSKDRDTYSSLRIPTHLAEEAYLAVFLSCWLCLFVLPSKSSDTIRPSVFKMACFMAKRNQFGLAIPVLSNIYRGLNIIIK
ncbi:hypothetical protein LIER_26398 [Lithospermum erythrorhizon]|uniref:Aminotransferase-like plant mobile domain-containing protein n=1 Tax=Lithospermum erythrorhizon TaxID=34254 RepID=A0AAV3RBF0_LITER